MTIFRILVFFHLLFFAPQSFASDLTPVVLQLQWKHQFEFAGFYAAKEKGYYKDAGLDVTFKEYTPDINIIDEVLAGRAQYGVTYSNLIYHYLHGDPLVFLANFFKQSPLVLAAQKTYTLPSDLKGKKIMGISSRLDDVELLMMFKKFNMDINSFTSLKNSFNLDDFIQKRVDAMMVFITNETYFLNKAGVPYNIIDPSSFGINFYDLNLFTSQKELSEHPQRVKRFYEASIKGWKYALSHKEEIIALILKKYNTQHKSKASLRYEADQTEKIMLTKLYPIGSIDPKRVKRLAESYIELGLLPANTPLDFDPFIYNPLPENLGLNKTEKAYLSGKQEIHYCADPNLIPFSRIKNGKHIGIDADFIDIISKKIKRPLHLVPTKNWEETLKLAQAHQCDFVSLIMKTPKRQKYLSFTEPILSVPLVLTTRIDKGFYTDINKLAGKTLGIVKGYAFSELFGSLYPDIKLIEVNSVNDGLEQVAKGKLFGFICNLTSAGYLIQNKYIGTLKVSAKLDEKLKLAYGVRKDNPVLLSILNKTINAIGPETRQTIVQHWASIRYEEEGISYQIAGMMSLLVLMFIGWILYQYRKLHKSHQSIENLSNRDSLTALFNRRYIEQCIMKQKDTNTEKGGSFSLILMDIDHFKTINDSHGHDIGDQVLVEVAHILAEASLQNSIVSRWGGEEFLLYCPNTVQSQAKQLAEHIRMAIMSHDFGNGIQITSSFGVAEYSTENSTDIVQLIRMVDKVLYKAKHSGRNRVVVAQ